jgi:hypothetical protein
MIRSIVYDIGYSLQRYTTKYVERRDKKGPIIIEGKNKKHCAS